VGIAYLGATTTKVFGLFETGGPVLSHASTHYFGSFGSIMLAIIILLACLTTSIGLITACGEYFHMLFPKISYKKFVLFFSLLSFTIANFGLANIINYSIPILMFLYPLAVVLMLLTFLSPIFGHARFVYVSVIAVTFCISIIDGFKTFCNLIGIPYFGWMKPIISAYEHILPFYNEGLGWLIPALVVILITGTISRLFGFSASTALSDGR
jgi:LIVCS family branched-chain amino acid:cation transporter